MRPGRGGPGTGPGLDAQGQMQSIGFTVLGVKEEGKAGWAVGMAVRVERSGKA